MDEPAATDPHSQLAQSTIGRVVIGAFVTAVLLMIGRSFLGLYMRNAFALSGLYGSLGLVPVFMFHRSTILPHCFEVSL